MIITASEYMHKKRNQEPAFWKAYDQHYGRQMCFFEIKFLVLTYLSFCFQVKIIVTNQKFWLLGRYDWSNIYEVENAYMFSWPLKINFGTDLCLRLFYFNMFIPSGRMLITILSNLSYLKRPTGIPSKSNIRNNLDPHFGRRRFMGGIHP